MVAIRHGSLSITGNFRENNEDRCLVDDEQRFFLVCDGMGGQAAGEKASELAIEIISEQLRKTLNFVSDTPEAVQEAVNKAVEHANLEIMALGEVDPDYHKMGTTLVFLINIYGTFYVGGIGDSRVYHLREETMTQLTKDHSLTQALIDAGTIQPEEAATHRFRNILFRYLGAKEASEGTDLVQVTPEEGDRFLLCSDGVMDGLDDEHIAEILIDRREPQQAAERLVSGAMDGGSKDNITCVVVYT